MLINSPIKNYHDEIPNKTRNPFEKITRIDCDKVFKSYNSQYSDCLKTSLRPDVSDELFFILENKLANNKYTIINIDENNLKLINKYIT